MKIDSIKSEWKTKIYELKHSNISTVEIFEVSGQLTRKYQRNNHHTIHYNVPKKLRKNFRFLKRHEYLLPKNRSSYFLQ